MKSKKILELENEILKKAINIALHWKPVHKETIVGVEFVYGTKKEGYVAPSMIYDREIQSFTRIEYYWFNGIKGTIILNKES